MRALLVVCLLAVAAPRAVQADELPTIDSEFPPTLRIWSDTWNVRFERVAVAIHSAPDTTFITLSVTGREQTITLPIDVPEGTHIVGLGVADTVWGRPMPVENARDRFRRGEGALLSHDSASAGQDHVRLVFTVPTTIEIALHLPPLQRLAIETNAGILGVEVDGDRRPAGKRRALVDLADVAGTTTLLTPHVDQYVSLVAMPTSPSDFFGPFDSRPRMTRDLDKAMIRRRMKWFRPGLRQCFMHAAQSDPSLTHGGVIVTFMIEPIGNVEWAITTESDLPEAVNTCLVDQVKQWEFPSADGRVQVNYPLEFRLIE